jgi:hypothetical protein
MEIRKVSDSVSIYSDGKRLQVIHDLGDEFILDLNILVEDTFNINGQMLEAISVIEPVFKVSGFCSKIGEGMHRLRWAIMQFDEFERYIKANQDDLLDWWENPGGK